MRQLGLALELSTRAAIRKPVTVDLFPAYDEDGGLLVALTPRTTAGTTDVRLKPPDRGPRGVRPQPDAGVGRGSIQSWRETASTRPSSP